MEKDRASTWERKEWEQLKLVVQRLQTTPKTRRLRDILIEWKAKTLSVMKSWPNHHEGTNYLCAADS